MADRYTLERVLGRGGMATVYLARDLKHDRLVAIKVLHPELATTLGPERFLREIKFAARLDHPHTLPLLDSGAVGILLWYSMPHVEGESLRERLRRETQLPIDQAVRIAREVADALAYAHRHGVVHRDIKPENILLADDHARVADFGVARALEAAKEGTLTETGLAVGTPTYMSPEQASGASVDARTDIYSLGCVLYEMLAGEPPFTGRTPQAIIARRLLQAPTPLGRLRQTVPSPIDFAVQKALAQVPADRFATAAEFSQALTVTPLAPVQIEKTEQHHVVAISLMRGWRINRSVMLGLGVLIAASFATATLLWLARPRPAALDASLIAVAPFDVLSPDLKLWREGLVDVLARALDGAGPLRTVSPTVIVRRWNGRADPASAATLGRRTGAKLTVFGSLVKSGADSIRLTATILDVAQERSLGDLEVRGAVEHMDRATDSLAVGLLRLLGRTRPVGVVRHAGIGAGSLPALRAFLRAEYHYRKGAYDSARVHAEQAVALDSVFALAYRRLGKAITGLGQTGDSLGDLYMVRAGSLNRDLAPRDSLLVLADSVFGTFRFTGAETSSAAARLLTIVEEAVRRYPEDPEAWFELGEVREHFGDWLIRPVGWEAKLESFERSIELDPLFAPAYYHPVALSYALGDTARARTFAEAAIKLNPRSKQTLAFQAIHQLLALTDPAAQERLLDTLSAAIRTEVYAAVERLLDPGELAVRVARHAVRMAGSGSDLYSAKFQLAHALALRGHVREALALGDTVSAFNVAEAALLGYVPAAKATATFEGWRRERPLFWSILALEWWGAQRDTTALRSFMDQVDSTMRAGSSHGDSASARHMLALAGGQVALARRDTTGALQAYAPVIGTVCLWWCQRAQLTIARLLVARGRLVEAAGILNVPSTLESEIPPRLSDVLWHLERGRVAERLRDGARAIKAYRKVAAAWQRPDAELEPYATEARKALERLGEVTAPGPDESR